MQRQLVLIAILSGIQPALAAPALDGIWAMTGMGDIVFSELSQTSEGEARQAAYDLLEDDPSLQCIPASLTRVYSNPNSDIEIRIGDDEVQIDYELFDLRRTIPLGAGYQAGFPPSTRNLKGELFPTMGSSIARFDGDQLVVETRGYAPGYLKTSEGLPQSEATQSIEQFWREGDQLRLRVTYTDPLLLEAPYTFDYRFDPSPRDELGFYGCEPESAGYDWFEKLNPPVEQ